MQPIRFLPILAARRPIRPIPTQHLIRPTAWSTRTRPTRRTKAIALIKARQVLLHLLYHRTLHRPAATAHQIDPAGRNATLNGGADAATRLTALPYFPISAAWQS